jgi:hypothetical protein
MEIGKNSREAPAPAGSAARSIRLCGQMFEWSYGYFDDRSGSEKLTAWCYGKRRRPFVSHQSVHLSCFLPNS